MKSWNPERCGECDPEDQQFQVLVLHRDQGIRELGIRDKESGIRDKGLGIKESGIMDQGIRKSGIKD